MFNIIVDNPETLGKHVVYGVKRASTNVNKSRVLCEKMALDVEDKICPIAFL